MSPPVRWGGVRVKSEAEAALDRCAAAVDQAASLDTSTSVLEHATGPLATQGATALSSPAEPGGAAVRGNAVWTFLGQGTYKASFEESFKAPLGPPPPNHYATLESVKVDADVRVEFGGDIMPEPNDPMTYDQGPIQVKGGFVGESKEQMGGPTSYARSAEAEITQRLDAELPQLARLLIPDKAKVAYKETGGELLFENSLYTDANVELGIRFIVVEKSQLQWPALQPLVRTRNFQVPFQLMGGQFGAARVSLAVSAKITPNYALIASEAAKRTAAGAAAAADAIAALGGGAEVAIIGSIALIPVAAWYTAFRNLSDSEAIKAATSADGLRPVMDFAWSYERAWLGQSPVDTPMGRAGADEARKRMPDPDASSPLNQERVTRGGLYAEGWDLVWPAQRQQIEAAFEDAHGTTSLRLLRRVLDAIGRQRGPR